MIVGFRRRFCMPENLLNILHVEDDISDAHIIQSYLKDKTDLSEASKKNYLITHYDCLKKALEHLDKNQNFSAILLDMNLPDGLGLENIKSIKRLAPDIPIVIITSVSDEKIAENALQIGAQECLVKSYGSAHLLKRVIQSSIIRKRAENALSKRADYDDLTGLPNRSYFENAARAMLQHAKRWQRRDALMFIDLNKFKLINDTYGHEAGNIVLRKVSERLRAILRSSDLIARYAGDEFVIYMDCGRAEVTEDLCKFVAEKIVRAVETPIDIGKSMLDVHLSIGIAIYPDAGENFDALLKNADKVMYEAKQSADTKYCIIGTNTR